MALIEVLPHTTQHARVPMLVRSRVSSTKALCRYSDRRLSIISNVGASANVRERFHSLSLSFSSVPYFSVWNFYIARQSCSSYFQWIAFKRNRSLENCWYRNFTSHGANYFAWYERFWYTLTQVTEQLQKLSAKNSRRLVSRNAFILRYRFVMRFYVIKV